MGDRILKVNGTDVTTATHQEAVMELLRPCDDIKLTVQHDPLPAGFQVRIEKNLLHTHVIAITFVYKSVNLSQISDYLLLHLLSIIYT